MRKSEKHEMKKNIAYLFRSSCYHNRTCIGETHTLKVRGVLVRLKKTGNMFHAEFYLFCPCGHDKGTGICVRHTLKRYKAEFFLIGSIIQSPKQRCVTLQDFHIEK